MSKSLNQINKEIKNAKAKLIATNIECIKALSNDVNFTDDDLARYDRKEEICEAKVDALKELKRKYEDTHGIIDEKRIVFCAKQNDDDDYYTIVNKKTGKAYTSGVFFTLEPAEKRAEYMNGNKYYNGTC